MSDSASQSRSGMPATKRRTFLFGSGLLAAGAALLSPGAKKTPPAEPVVAEAKPTGNGYRDGERARRYYNSARI
ncbi:MAG: hypothetical protein ACK4XK_10885 [Casimicrobiaceae bacterium]